MRERAPSLRSIVTTIALAMGALAILMCGALLVLTSYLQRTHQSLGASIENIVLAEETEVDLLLHPWSREPAARRELEAALVAKLTEARRLADDATQIAHVASAEAHVSAYLAAAREPTTPPTELWSRQLAAYGALEALVTATVEDTRRVQAQAIRWDELATWLGATSGALLIGVTVWLLWWFRRRALTPLFALAAAMKRFAAGDRAARADERGAEELRAMVRQFNEMAQAIADGHAAQLALVGGVAHDLRSPLATLKLATEMLDPDGPSLGPAERRVLLERMNRQLAHLARMVDDFLQVSTLEAGTLALDLARHDLRALVRDVVAALGDPGARHRVEVDLPDHPVEVRCDLGRIDQSLTNLVSNAIKYSPAGGVVRISLGADGERAYLSVSDEGIGISADEQRQLFAPFRRLERGRALPGIGLGLFIVRRLIEAHGGVIEIASEPRAGSTFTIRLPLADRAAARVVA